MTFPPKSVFPAYRRTKNLKEILAPSKFGGTGSVNHTRQETGGCFKCNKRCDLCQKFLIQDTKFRSFATGRVYMINQQLSCTSKNVIYLAACDKCKKQYVGSTSTEFKVRFRNHKSSMLNKKRTCELAVHYNSFEHQICQISFIREAYWTSQLFSLHPHGLNKRREFKSKNRICYNS